jgi:hypothetical protein
MYFCSALHAAVIRLAQLKEANQLRRQLQTTARSLVFQTSGAPTCDGELWNECALQLDNDSRSTQRAKDLQQSIKLLCAVLETQACTAPGQARCAEASNLNGHHGHLRDIPSGNTRVGMAG